ncbi:MAG: carbohydrate kinase family protein [Thermoguttaceae bacterium]|nr:carbohydrate kinase family protein [Thermoguttaceae bacterium]
MNKKHRCLSAGILFADVGCQPIDHLPVPGELVPTQQVQLMLGGCASNVALNLAQLEVPVGLCGCVGDEAFSDFVVRSLEHPLIDTAGIKRAAHCGPGCTMIVNVKGQDRRFISTNGANAGFTAAVIPDAWAQEAEVFYLGGYLMMLCLEDDTMVEFFKKFHARGGKTILDVVLFGTRPYWDVIKPLLPHVDYFTPNNDEAKLICGLDDPVDQAKYFFDAGAKATVVTCGEAGSVFYSQNDRFRTKVFPVEFVGGTGSGDAFAAGFISAILDGGAPEDLMQTASAQGMSCVRDLSATGSVFTKAESKAFLAKNRLEIETIG